MARSDTEFARTAVALKLITAPQANECLQLFAQQRKQGEDARCEGCSPTGGGHRGLLGQRLSGRKPDDTRASAGGEAER